MYQDPNNNNNNNIETLGNPNPTQPTDIPKTFFRPIDQIQNQQQEYLYQYNTEKGNIANPTVPDLSNEVRELEKKLQKKKLSMPASIVLLIVVFVNICWFLGVQFLIVPKYEEYVKQSEEMKKNYDDLKRKVDAIVGN